MDMAAAYESITLYPETWLERFLQVPSVLSLQAHTRRRLHLIQPYVTNTDHSYTLQHVPIAASYLHHKNANHVPSPKHWLDPPGAVVQATNLWI